MRQEQKKHEEFVKNVDPALRYLQDYTMIGANDSVKIFLVEDNTSKYVLKAKNNYKQIDKEIRALETLDDVKWVINLEHNYGKRTIDNNDYKIILREYFEGNDFDMNEKEAEPYSKIHQGLIKTLDQIHQEGIAVYDIWPFNILVSPNKKEARFMDLDACIFKDQCKNEEFENAKYKDYKFLNSRVIPLNSIYE